MIRYEKMLENRDKYERKQAFVINKNLANKKIKTLTEKQHNVLAWLASIRHEMHVGASSFYDSESSDYDRFHNYVEEEINKKLKKVKLKPIKFKIDLDSFPADYDRHEGLIDNTEEAEEENRKEALRLTTKINTIIEVYLTQIDKKHGTIYAPTGYARYK